MIQSRKIELLAPARNLACGLEAVRQGADAVYIGAPRFGARAAAGNSLEDIRQLVEYAHLFRVRVYVTVNTILKDEELDDTTQMIQALYQIGVDALIVQDMALLRLPLPPIPLHASTQMDNRTPEKVAFLQQAGFRQAVLARELTLAEIRSIHEQVPQLPLEVFVHGALCVSYSGQCYASQACFGRSANRGECAQFCRLPFDMVDAEGRTVFADKYPLSLKDLCQADQLEQLLDAGVSSLKIEGRLKDVSYVKNITAYYRQKLDALFARRPEYRRASSGTVRLQFHPQPARSFNRGFTSYFLNGRTEGICSFDTPKAMGEEMGRVQAVRGGVITLAPGARTFHNGDGACYLDEQGRLVGFRINRAEQNRLFPQERCTVRPRTVLYRNFDQDFERQLAKPTAERRLAVQLALSELPDGFLLRLSDEDGCAVACPFRREKELARRPQTEAIREQLGKLGDTVFEATRIEVNLGANYFIPFSVLAEVKRQAVERLLLARRLSYPQERARMTPQRAEGAYQGQRLTYLANCHNALASEQYRAWGAEAVAPSFEQQTVPGAALMFTRHCIRYMMGWCPRHHRQTSPFHEPYQLVSKDGRRFRLEFYCRHCQMKVYEA